MGRPFLCGETTTGFFPKSEESAGRMREKAVVFFAPYAQKLDAFLAERLWQRREGVSQWTDHGLHHDHAFDPLFDQPCHDVRDGRERNDSATEMGLGTAGGVGEGNVAPLLP